ncbi:transposable element Tcb2 transposase [Trichonephila clavipes]|nr:transposable element Tcb2 transposase [Trichonephila clavipes]
MSSRHHIDDFMRGRIIGKIEEGRKITDVAREFNIAPSVVSRLSKSFNTTGMCSRRPGGGRVRTQQVANQFLAASGKQISRKTVARRLRGGGLYARGPVVCVPLTRQHRTARLQWCREHHNWTEQDWAFVLFSDESRFSLSSDCRRQLIWRESGTAYRPENIQEKDRYPTCSIMVWAGIMINGLKRLNVFANGTMTGQRYIDEVLLPRVRLFRGAVGDKFVFMDDNATCHRTLAVQDCIDSEGIQRLVWPASSPDLNPIENVWDALGRQVAGRNYPPTNKNTLIRALTEEWDKLPQQLLDNVVQNYISYHLANNFQLSNHTKRPRKWLTSHVYMIPNSNIHVLLLELVGKNCHPGSKEIPRGQLIEIAMKAPSQIIEGQQEAGWEYYRIARHINRRDASVRRCGHECSNNVRFQRHDDSSRSRVKAELEVSFIVISAVTVPNTLLLTIRRATRTRVSTMTIHRRLIHRSLRLYRPLRHLPLTTAQCQAPFH